MSELQRQPKYVAWLLGVVGGCVGGAIGYYAFFFLARHGLYAMMLPGTLLGLGCGWLAGIESRLLAIGSGMGGLLLGLFTEWRLAPFVDDDSFAYFMTHLHDLRPMTLIMVGLGGLFGFWLGRGRAGRAGTRPTASAPGGGAK